MVRIRLARAGAKKRPFYRIVAADKRMKRDGRFLEKLGTYDPLSKETIIEKEKIQKWLSVGASASETVVKLLIKEGFDLKVSYTPKEKSKKEEEPKEEPKAEESAAAKEEAKVEESTTSKEEAQEEPEESTEVESSEPEQKEETE